jgi:hypothetical protein
VATFLVRNYSVVGISKEVMCDQPVGAEVRTEWQSAVCLSVCNRWDVDITPSGRQVCCVLCV